MSDNPINDLKKLAYAGLGAAALVTEKSVQWIDDLSKKGVEVGKDAQPIIDDLAKKGAEAFDKGKVIGGELKTKLQKAFDDCNVQMEQQDLDEVKHSVQGLSDEALSQLKAHLDAEMRSRQKAPAAPKDPDGENEGDDPSEAPES